MFGLFKSKGPSTSTFEMCIDYLTFKIGPVRAEKEATQVALFIWAGLGRMSNEGMQAKFFGDIAKSEANKIMEVRGALGEEVMIESSRNVIAWMFFDLIENGWASQARLTSFNKIIDYLCMFSKGELVKGISDLLQLNIPEARFKRPQNVQPSNEVVDYYALDLKNENHIEYAQACIAFNGLDNKDKLRALNFCSSILNDSISHFGNIDDIIKLKEVDFLLLRCNLAEIESKKPSTYPLMTFLDCSFSHWREDGQSFDKVFLDNWSSLLEALETGYTAISFIAPDLATGTFPEPLKLESTKTTAALNPAAAWPFSTGVRP